MAGPSERSVEVRRAPARAHRPAVSVIVVSRNRRPELEAALASVAVQTPPAGGFEIVALDDASTDDTWCLLSGAWLAEATPFGKVAVRAATQGGPGAARNLAACHARGAVLAFLDSDCVAAPDWLGALVAPLSDPEVGAVGGREVDDPREPPLARAVHFALTSPWTTGRVRGGEGARAGRYRPRSFSMAVRTEALERVGGFQGMSHGEDVELSLRIEKSGATLVFAREARVHHRRRRTWGAVWSQAFEMGRARPRLMRIDRGHVEPIYLLPTALVLGAVGLGGVALAVPAARLAALAVFVLGALYAGVVGAVATTESGEVSVGLLAPGVFALQQVAYGAGFVLGAARELAGGSR